MMLWVGFRSTHHIWDIAILEFAHTSTIQLLQPHILSICMIFLPAINQQNQCICFLLTEVRILILPTQPTIVFYSRLFKKLDADILAVMTYAARYSVFNPIEHCWSPLSNKLSSVIFSPLEKEDDVSAPGLQSELSKEDLKIKEKIVFDRAMNSLSECH